MRRSLQFLFCLCFALLFVRANGQPFDLSGPKVDVHVKRGDVTLPISEVPNLMPGDRLWVHPDLPESQATHFVLVVAFLRGSTNPPPPDWFTRVETWTREARDEGVFVVVPEGAQQALLFLAPETGGDFNTLRNTVRGRPGSFVRAAQDLQAASWERMRLEAYLNDVKVSSQFDPQELKKRTEMAARSLGIKINEACFDKPPEEQAPCLSQNSEGLVLDDANAQSLMNQFATGDTLNLMNAISSSSMAGGGLYSPYVGAVVDIAKILSSLHTAHFQYIPALALPTADSLNLRLNMPPSFRNPMSVVVVALPPVGNARPQPLHPVNPDDHFCALKPGLVLPAEGAPLIFATDLAHDLSLHVEPADGKGKAKDISLEVDADKGGLVPIEKFPALPSGELTAVVRGKWGFDDWVGPQFHLVSAQPGEWSVDAADRSALVVGRDDALELDGQTSDCVEKVTAQIDEDPAVTLAWKSPKPSEMQVTIPLSDAEPGPVTLEISEFGLAKPDRLKMVAYAAAASLYGLTLNSGDKIALLKGTRLDEVARAEVGEVTFTPSTLNRVENLDQLEMTSAGSTDNLEGGKPYVALVELKDGRTLKAPVTVDQPRPRVTLLNEGIQEDGASPSPVAMSSPTDLPVDGRLVFFLKSDVPAEFPRDEKIEVAAADSSFHTVLALSDGSLMLEDAHTAEASLEPLARFGSSAFGPVRVRAISAGGAAGNWVPLGTLVRIPGFKELRCPRALTKPCVLSGTDLFLATSISATASFDSPVNVPPEFTGTELVVPHPVTKGVLYLKLRDDPANAETLTLPVTLMPAVEAATVATPAAATAQATPAAQTPAAAQEPATAGAQIKAPPANQN
ncbi:MAG TPA: hypothetical protein VMT38_12525 [Terracidiphilus sp.]|nr:hypothetical protein [Terracidiphilus sp.]